MKSYSANFSLSVFIIFIITVFTISSCSPTQEIVNEIRIFEVQVEAVDTNSNPIPGAVVEASNGEQTSTDSTGTATLEFGAAGVYTVTVMADNRAPSTFTVTMPTDEGEKMTARLAEKVTYTGYADFRTGNMGQFYNMMFNWMFSSYGYKMDLSDYESGEWTEWRIHTPDSENPVHFRKAFLKEMENGRQWWKIKMKGEQIEDQYVVEVLFSEDRNSIRRIREKIGDEEPRERPVTENWYNSPRELTQESIEGGVTEEGISVETPAGSFSADLIEFGVSPSVALRLWRVSEVPGGVAKYLTQNSEDESMIYRSELFNHGSGAETELNSY